MRVAPVICFDRPPSFFFPANWIKNKVLLLKTTCSGKGALNSEFIVRCFVRRNPIHRCKLLKVCHCVNVVAVSRPMGVKLILSAKMIAATNDFRSMKM